MDVVAKLPDQDGFQNAGKYCNKLKEMLVDKVSETVTNCHQLKMLLL
jgi:hypothetical protein